MRIDVAIRDGTWNGRSEANQGESAQQAREDQA